MRDRRPSSHVLALSGALLLALLVMGCAGAGLAARAGFMPAVDWQIRTGEHRVLLIHNGPTTSCRPFSLRDSCRRQVVRHEFYVHYITPDADHRLIWFEIRGS